jgi:hypothetical protein
MPRIMVTMKLTEDERVLLARRAEKEGLTEADYLRMCMLMDSLMSGDFAAAKIFGQKVKTKLAEKMGVAFPHYSKAKA